MHTLLLFKPVDANVQVQSLILSLKYAVSILFLFIIYLFLGIPASMLAQYGIPGVPGLPGMSIPGSAVPTMVSAANPLSAGHMHMAMAGGHYPGIAGTSHFTTFYTQSTNFFTTGSFYKSQLCV